MTISKYRQRIKMVIAALVMVGAVLGTGLPSPQTALAAKEFQQEQNNNTNTFLAKIGSQPNQDDCKPPKDKKLNKDNCTIIKVIVDITNILGGIAGLVIISTMIYGGIQYSMAGADPSKIQAAKHKIIVALTALLLLIFGFALLQWLVPGGIF